MIVEVRDDYVSTRVYGRVVRPSELVQLRAAGAKLGEDFAGWLEDVNTGTFVVHNNQLPGVGHRHPLRAQQLGAGHLHDKLAAMFVY